MWLVNIDELQFDDPVEVIGQGSFGVVLLGRYRGTKVALKRAIKINANNSRHSKRKRSRNGSKGSGSGLRSDIQSTNMDSVQTDSCGLSAADSDPDPEAGSALSLNEGESSNTGSRHSQGSNNSGARAGSQNKSSSRNSYSLGFLAEDFGPNRKWAWLCPWMKSNDYHSRFKESILGGGSGTIEGKSWHAIICPWFSAEVRREEEFIQEMRVLSRLRHPCITTVLGAVISRSHDPMLVSKCHFAILTRLCQRCVLIFNIFQQWNTWNMAVCTTFSETKLCI